MVTASTLYTIWTQHNTVQYDDKDPLPLAVWEELTFVGWTTSGGGCAFKTSTTPIVWPSSMSSVYSSCSPTTVPCGPSILSALPSGPRPIMSSPGRAQFA